MLRCLASTLVASALVCGAAAADAALPLAFVHGGTRLEMPPERVLEARPDRAPDGSWQVLVRFDATGARAFAELTAGLVGEPLAIEVDGTVVTAPVVREPILGGSVAISGGFDEAEARRIARAITARAPAAADPAGAASPEWQRLLDGLRGLPRGGG